MTTPPQHPGGPGPWPPPQHPWGGGRGPYPQQPLPGSPYPQQPWGPPHGQPWGPPPPPPKRSRPLLVTGAVVLVLLVVSGLVLATTRGTDGPSTATATTTSRSTTTGSGSASSTGSAPSTTTAAPTRSELSVDLVVGDCVHVSGSTSSPDLAKVACGSADSSYTVAATADRSDDCASDSDYVYYEMSRFGDDELGALCMDVDWAEGECFDLGTENVVRIDCAVPGSDVEKVGRILRGTTDDSSCPQGGYTYDERELVVCLETITSA